MTVTRTGAGIAVSGACADEGERALASFRLDLLTRTHVEAFLSHLRWPIGEPDYDQWVGVLTVDGGRPVEPRIGTSLGLDWSDSAPTVIGASVRLLLWADFGEPAVLLDLDLAAVLRLHDAVAACVDDDLPGRAPEPSTETTHDTPPTDAAQAAATTNLRFDEPPF